MSRPHAYALIGHTGLVGGTLTRAQSFSAIYNSKTIAEIRGRTFDLVICAGTPANMWAANQHPDADKANLDSLEAHLREVRTERLLLISTIAVLDDASAGYTERTAQYEAVKAYGRNRRDLEMRLQDRFPKSHIVRLPALFGPGLKKNFVFDILNPMPSYLRQDRLNTLLTRVDARQAGLLSTFYKFDGGLNMMQLDRPAFDRSVDREALIASLEAAGLDAPMFTNSRSRFQYYDLTRLSDDIEWVIQNEIEVLNICSQPLEAGEVYAALTGRAFHNEEPPIVNENVRSEHSALFGEAEPYLFDQRDTLARLTAFARAERAR